MYQTLSPRHLRTMCHKAWISDCIASSFGSCTAVRDFGTDNCPLKLCQRVLKGEVRLCVTAEGKESGRNEK